MPSITPEHLRSLISDTNEIRTAHEKLIIPRIHLRERYLEAAQERTIILGSAVEAVETIGVDYPGASSTVLTRLRRLNLNPGGVFLSASISQKEADMLYMPLAGVTRKMLLGMAFDTLPKQIIFYNTVISDYMNESLDTLIDDHVELYIKNFIMKSHHAAGGAGWDGDSRNLGGRVMAVAFQQQLIAAFLMLGIPWLAFLRRAPGSAIPNSQVSDLILDPSDSGSQVVRFIVDKRLEIKFGEPDIQVRCLTGSHKPQLFGELKGRTDLSNLYESWLPTVRQKLERFQRDHPDATRIVVQLFITEVMLGDTNRSELGFEDMRASGLLDTVYSIVKLENQASERERLANDLQELIAKC